MVQEICVIDDETNLTQTLTNMFQSEKEYKFRNVNTENICLALKSIPSLIIINEDTIGMDIIELCNLIRQDDDNSITPIIVIGESKVKLHRLEILKLNVEYYVVKPIDEEYLYYTIKNIVRLMYMNRRVSPLTGLPGNVQIQTEMKKRLAKKQNFSILYLDLDNFKAYNDLYGFAKGDEVIKFTARTISKNIHNEMEDCFIGHIGGDDFVAMVSNSECEQICKNIIEDFDKNILQFFTKEDIEKGYLEVANRRRIIEQFPLTSISIGVVVVDAGRFHNVLEIGEVAAQVKHVAKTTVGSTYIIDRRK